MAGRIRTIKPEILEDEHAANLSHMAWRLWVSSFLLADDFGNFRANPAWLAGQIFWGNSRESRESVAAALEELATCKGESGLLQLYENHGQKYAHVAGWHHQKVDKVGKPRCPGPDDSDSKRLQGFPARLSRESRESLAKPPEGVAPYQYHRPVPVPPTSTSTSGRVSQKVTELRRARRAAKRAAAAAPYTAKPEQVVPAESLEQVVKGWDGGWSTTRWLDRWLERAEQAAVRAPITMAELLDLRQEIETFKAAEGRRPNIGLLVARLENRRKGTKPKPAQLTLPIQQPGERADKPEWRPCGAEVKQLLANLWPGSMNLKECFA